MLVTKSLGVLESSVCHGFAGLPILPYLYHLLNNLGI